MKDCSNKAITSTAIFAALHIITAPKNLNRIHWFDEITTTVMSWLGMNAIILLCVMDQNDVPWETINIGFFTLYGWYFYTLIREDIAVINDERQELKEKAKKRKENYVDPYSPNIFLRVQSFIALCAILAFLLFITHNLTSISLFMIGFSITLFILFFVVLIIKDIMYKDTNNGG